MYSDEYHGEADVACQRAYMMRELAKSYAELSDRKAKEMLLRTMEALLGTLSRGSGSVTKLALVAAE